MRNHRTVKASLSGSRILARIVSAAPSEKRDELKAFVLEGLANDAAFDPWVTSATDYAEPMRKRAMDLRAFAKRVRTLAERARKLTENRDDQMLDFCASGDKYLWAPAVIARMEQCASAVEFQARAFGHYTRSVIPSNDRAFMIVVAAKVQKETSKAFHRELAKLFSDAHRAVGKTRIITTDQFSKIVKRSSNSPTVLRPS